MSENEFVDMTFGQLLKLAIDGKTTALPVAPSALHKTAHGGIMHLPVEAERFEISAGDVPSTPSQGRVSWLETTAIPLLSDIPTIAVPEKTGVLPIGGRLPSATMQREHETGSDHDPSIVGIAYDLSSVIEARTMTSTQAVMQASEPLLDALESAHRISLAEMILRQLLTGGGGYGASATATLSGGSVSSITVDEGGNSYLGPISVTFEGGGGTGAMATASIVDGSVTAINVTDGGTSYATVPTVVLSSGDGEGNNISSIVSDPLVTRTEYAAASKGADRVFRPAEIAVQDASGSPSAWALGGTLESSARAVVVEPGGSRRVIEGREMLLSGVPTFRNTDMNSNMGIVADWRRAIMIITGSTIEYTIDKITRPGDLKITSRLPVDVRVVRPTLVQVINEA